MRAVWVAGAVRVVNPGATGYLKEPVGSDGLPTTPVVVLSDAGHDGDTGEAMVAVAVAGEPFHTQRRPRSVKQYKAAWVAVYEWRRVPVSEVTLDNPEPSYTAVSKAAAAICASLWVTHVAGGPWSSSDVLLLGAALSLASPKGVEQAAVA